MSKKREAFLPLFFGDFLAATAEWEGEDRSLYLLLLGYQWSLGSLPADMRKLAKVVCYDEKTFKKHWPTVSKKFNEKNGRLYNERLEDHRKKSVELSGKNSNSGKKGAEARWGKDSERHRERHSETDDERHKNANSVTNSNPSYPILSHVPIDTSSRTSTSVEARAAAEPGFPKAGELAPEAAMAIPLRDLGVQVTSQHPALLAWIRDGFTPQQAIHAVGIARIRKKYPEAIPAMYLDKILREPTPESPQRKTKFEQAMDQNFISDEEAKAYGIAF